MKLIASTPLLLLSGIAALLNAQRSSAATLTFINSCNHQIGLYDNVQEVPMAPGAVQVRDASPGFKGMYRAGKNPQATLAEFTFDGGKLWYDISIIPTSAAKGPEYCPSLAACKQLTGGTGYNEPMQIAPQSNTNGAYCRVLTCLNDGCDDAYQFPKDDTKTHNCPGNTDFVITFCPGGPGGATPAPTQAPTTTAPPTQPPPTPAPTPVPTEATPIPTEATPAPAASTSLNNTDTSNQDLVSEVAGEADNLSAASFASEAPAIATGVAPEVGAESQSLAEASTTPGVTEAAATATPTATEAPATEVSTQSSNSESSAMLSVVVVGALVVAATAAVAMIVVMRRKKRELDAQTEKSPIMNPGLATL